MHVLLIAVFAVLLTASPALAIVDGEPDDGRHPTVGLLALEEAGQHYIVCSGWYAGPHRDDASPSGSPPSISPTPRRATTAWSSCRGASTSPPSGSRPRGGRTTSPRATGCAPRRCSAGNSVACATSTRGGRSWSTARSAPRR